MYRESRKGFTLIEMMVVLALIAILGSLTIAFMPSAANQERESRAATLLQGWLNVAKQRALRDQAPRGVRLTLASANTVSFGGTYPPNIVVQCEYIEQPEDFWNSSSPIASIPAQLLVRYSAQGYSQQNTLMVSGTDLTNGYTTNSSIYVWTVQPWTVQLGNPAAGNYEPPQQLQAPPQRANSTNFPWQAGDMLQLNGNGLMHRVMQIGMPGTQNLNSCLCIDPPLQYPLTQTVNYRVLRTPRTVGDPLKLPDGTVIDLNPNINAGVGNVNVNGGAGIPAQYVNVLPLASTGTDLFLDILFSPSGAVITRGISVGSINLWVRAPGEGGTPGSDGDTTNWFGGRPTIVAVFVNSGFVGAYPTDKSTTNPYLHVGK
jgi:prepilin-type N-terminal cleavage/methylation domain-containing protein